MKLTVLDCQKIYFDYPGKKVLENISFTLATGEIGVLLGPSGCGKTTMLRLIAGLEKPQKGVLSILGKNKSGKEAADHSVGFVFQDYALFPHLTVAQNIGFAIAKWPKIQREEKIAELIQIFGLEAEKGKYPHQISGGQQQRTAIARSLAIAPALLLMDEPFSNIDFSLRQVIIEELRAIFKKLSITCLFVTHDLTEAFSFADQMGVLDKGRLLQWGAVSDLLYHPVCREVSQILQTGNLIDFSLLGHNSKALENKTLQSLLSQQTQNKENSSSQFLFLPHGRIRLSSEGEECELRSILNTGKILHLQVLWRGLEFLIMNPIDLSLKVGQRLHLEIDWQEAILLGDSPLPLSSASL